MPYQDEKWGLRRHWQKQNQQIAGAGVGIRVCLFDATAKKTQVFTPKHTFCNLNFWYYYYYY
jgi:hypothetical protein